MTTQRCFPVPGCQLPGEVLRHCHPHYQFLPLLELLAVNSPDAYESC